MTHMLSICSQLISYVIQLDAAQSSGADDAQNLQDKQLHMDACQKEVRRF